MQILQAMKKQKIIQKLVIEYRKLNHKLLNNNINIFIIILLIIEMKHILKVSKKKNLKNGKKNLE